MRGFAALLLALFALVSPVSADTLVDNVNGYTLDSRGAIQRFNGLLIADDGKVKQWLQRKDKRPYARYKTDAKGRTLIPGLIAPHVRLMALGTAATDAGRSKPDNPVVREAALAKALEILASAGITMVHDAGTSLDDWLLYRRFGDEGRLTARIYAMAAGSETAERLVPLRPTPWLYQDRLIMRSVLFGGADAPDARDVRLKNQISKALMAGLQPVLVTAGESQDRQAVDIYEELAVTYGTGRRMRIDRRSVVPSADGKRAASNGVIISIIPEDALAQLAKAGAAQALPGSTAEAAVSAFAEDRAGTLEPGKWADFILIDRDIFASDPASDDQPQVLETWLAGRRVWVRK